MEALESLIGHRFANLDLLKQALIHPSKAHEIGRGSQDNQRLEFLGDAVLQLMVTQWALERFPQEQEGRLTQWRAQVVSSASLAKIAAKIKLAQWVQLGRGELAQGGLSNENILADTLEAVIGAIFLDGGYAAAQSCLRHCLLPAVELALDDLTQRNPKGLLQEKLQDLAPHPPQYEVTESQNGGTQDRFLAKVLWQGKVLGQGSGGSKKRAQIAAATDALDQFNNPVNALGKAVNE